MPELPEVDLVARTLDTILTGKRIVCAELRRSRLAPEMTPRGFASKLKNSSVLNVRRRGKHILIDLDNGHTLIVHLRMSGRFMMLDAELDDPKFAHAAFHLADGRRLVFDDQRHFGLMKIVNTLKIGKTPDIAKLGPEPLSDDFTVEHLASNLARSSKSIKEFLLDQTRVVGLGNIYAAEALFIAGIDPKLAANKLKKRQIPLLHSAIKDVIAAAIEESKLDDIDEQNIDGRYGSGDAKWLVYGREGETCVKCSSTIVRLKQGGRSTFYCRICQKR